MMNRDQSVLTLSQGTLGQALSLTPVVACEGNNAVSVVPAHTPATMVDATIISSVVQKNNDTTWSSVVIPNNYRGLDITDGVFIGHLIMSARNNGFSSGGTVQAYVSDLVLSVQPGATGGHVSLITASNIGAGGECVSMLRGNSRGWNDSTNIAAHLVGRSVLGPDGATNSSNIRIAYRGASSFNVFFHFVLRLTGIRADME